MKLFVVGIQGSTPEQEKAFHKWLNDDNDLGFWHWIPNFWIISTVPDTYTVAKIRDKIMETFPTMDTLVIEIKGGPLWAGYGPKNEKRDMFAWIRKHF